MYGGVRGALRHLMAEPSTRLGTFKIMDLEERAEHEIELIEQDETLTDKERSQAIRDVVQELREALRDQENCW